MSTRIEMVEIIEQALQTHCWSSHGKTLPEVIADAIIEKQAMQHKHWKERAEKCELNLQDYHQMHDRERDLRIAAEAERDKLKAQVERLQDQVKRREEENERLIVILKDQRDALSAQVKRLLAEESERIREALNKRLDEPLPTLGGDRHE